MSAADEKSSQAFEALNEFLGQFKAGNKMRKEQLKEFVKYLKDNKLDGTFNNQFSKLVKVIQKAANSVKTPVEVVGQGVQPAGLFSRADPYTAFTYTKDALKAYKYMSM